MRFVRGNPYLPSNDFIDNNDKTISDKNTLLMWQKEDGGTMIWEAAIQRCETLRLGEHNDWRLPNIKELESIIDHKKIGPAIDQNYFSSAMSAGYWSSTTFINNSEQAWAIYFYDGYIGSGNYFTGKDYKYYGRCVRNDTKELLKNIPSKIFPITNLKVTTNLIPFINRTW